MACVYSVQELRDLGSASAAPVPRVLVLVMQQAHGAQLSSKSSGSKSSRWTRGSTTAQPAAAPPAPLRNRSATPWLRKPCADDAERTVRSTKGLLNRLSAQNVDRICARVVSEVPLATWTCVQHVVLATIDKAIDEPNFAGLYVMLCRYLHAKKKHLVQKFVQVEHAVDSPEQWRWTLKACSSDDDAAASEATFASEDEAWASAMDTFNVRNQIIEACNTRFGTQALHASASDDDMRRTKGLMTFLCTLWQSGAITCADLHHYASQLAAQPPGADSAHLYDRYCVLAAAVAKGDKKFDHIDAMRACLQAVHAAKDIPSRIRFAALNVLENR